MGRPPWAVRLGVRAAGPARNSGGRRDDPTPRLDVRAYVESKSFTGWGRGVSLTLAEVELLEAQLPAIKTALVAAQPLANAA